MEYHNPKEIDIEPRWVGWILMPLFAVVGVVIFGFILIYCGVVQIYDWCKKK